jgi:cellulose synthase/poly-beta-1,6-N-acetylglucosamine synthase-like glycosyltransferase
MPLDIEEIRKEYVRLKSYDIRTFVPDPEALSVIIITKNEEKNIERCLKSVQFADEIILVDSGSTDKTLEMASRFPKVKIISVC